MQTGIEIGEIGRTCLTPDEMAALAVYLDGIRNMWLQVGFVVGFVGGCVIMYLVCQRAYGCKE